MAPQRQRITPNATLGDPATYTIEVVDGYGDLVDLDEHTPTCTSYDPDGVELTPTIAAKSPQTTYRGQMTVTYAEGVLDTIGVCLLTVKVEGEPTVRKYQFEVEAEDE